MHTRANTLSTPNDAPTDHAHVEALGKAMAAHPAVKVELDAARRQVQAAERKAAALQGVLDDYAASIGTVTKAVESAGAAPVISDEECLKRFEAMTPAERALLMMRTTAPVRFDIHKAPGLEGGFRS